MGKQTVAILFGGCSSEYEVSLNSAASVLMNLDRHQYHVVMVGITKQGQWFRYEGDIEDIRSDRWWNHVSCVPSFITPSRDVRGLISLQDGGYKVTPIDVVFPMLHGKNGEDGTVQGLLELSGIPYVGCDMLSSAICMDKEITHTLVKASGIETPWSLTIYEGNSVDQAILDVEQMGFPLYVKPAKAGSSFGITKAYNARQLGDGIRLAFSHDNKVVIEQNVDGFEVGCAILGNENPIVGEVDEIEIEGGFFNYEEKYSLSHSIIHLPARIDSETAFRVKETALHIYRTLGCRGFARVDMFLTPDGRLVFNEVNTIPGFTSKSRYPNMLRAIDISYDRVVEQLIELAVAKG